MKKILLLNGAALVVSLSLCYLLSLVTPISLLYMSVGALIITGFSVVQDIKKS